MFAFGVTAKKKVTVIVLKISILLVLNQSMALRMKEWGSFGLCDGKAGPQKNLPVEHYFSLALFREKIEQAIK